MTDDEELELLRLRARKAAARKQTQALAQAKPTPQMAAPKAPDEPSTAQAILAGVQNPMALPVGDELGGAIQAGLMKASGEQAPFGEMYRKYRDELRSETKAAQKSHPMAF